MGCYLAPALYNLYKSALDHPVNWPPQAKQIFDALRWPDYHAARHARTIFQWAQRFT